MGPGGDGDEEEKGALENAEAIQETGAEPDGMAGSGLPEKKKPAESYENVDDILYQDGDQQAPPLPAKPKNPDEDFGSLLDIPVRQDANLAQDGDKAAPPPYSNC